MFLFFVFCERRGLKEELFEVEARSEAQALAIFKENNKQWFVTRIINKGVVR